MIFGLDLLAGTKYKKEVIKFSGWALGGFAETFGDFYPVAEQAFKKGCQHIRVQLLWSDSHSFGDDNDILKIRKFASKYQKLANQFPMRTLELSTFCEHNLANPDKYHDIAQLAAPSCTIINTPWKGAFSNKYKNEIHGDHAKPSGRYNYSFDGTEATNADVETILEKHKNAEVFFMWSARFNLKWSMKDTTPRPQRKAFPTSEYIDSIVYLFGDKGNYSIPKGWLIKSHSERHSATDMKGDKLLIISPIKANSIELKRGKKLIGKLKYYGSFDGGGFRYYSNSMGFKLGKDLDVYIGNKKYGTINAGFRSAPFRD